MKSIVFSALFVGMIAGNAAHSWESTDIDTVETRYENGEIKEEYQRVLWGGNEEYYKIGFYRAFFPNGHIQTEGYYSTDGKIGTWIEWDSLGSRVKETTFSGGKKNGSAITWNSEGTIASRLRFRNDTLHGLCIWMKSSQINGIFNNPNLTVDSELFYVQGLVVCPSYYFGNYRDGVPEGFPQLPYYNADLDLWVELFPNTYGLHIGRKIDGKKQGVWTLWAKDGTMIRQDYYKDDQLLR